MFLLLIIDIRQSLEENGKVKKLSDTKIKEFKDSALRCNHCDYLPKNMPDLKQHLTKHNKSNDI
jgi:hypothetical protein